MGRDVGRDEGREQAEWRDLVARLEFQPAINPEDAPWPDRENLRARTQPGTVSSTEGSGPSGADLDGEGRQPGNSGPGNSGPGDAGIDGAVGGNAGIDGAPQDGETSRGRRGSASRGRVIRPAGFARFGWPARPAAPASTEARHDSGSDADERAAAEAAGTGAPTLGGPRDYELDEPSDDDLDEDGNDRYIPPSLPPQARLDPVAKGAWLALFGGPGYLLVATLLSWQIDGWAALTAVIAFVAGFVVLVFRLGDGPSRRDGPDQGAVV